MNVTVKGIPMKVKNFSCFFSYQMVENDVFSQVVSVSIIGLAGVYFSYFFHKIGKRIAFDHHKGIDNNAFAGALFYLFQRMFDGSRMGRELEIKLISLVMGGGLSVGDKDDLVCYENPPVLTASG